LLGFVGVRDVVALAAALAIPLTTTAGGPELPANYCRVGG
jgi:NhaP-type Na+/H+ or K+/H+ antiporter